MRIAFLTEMGFEGKISVDHPNMRTEFAWMHALDADHHCIYHYNQVKNYEHVFVIFVLKNRTRRSTTYRKVHIGGITTTSLQIK